MARAIPVLHSDVMRLTSELGLRPDDERVILNFVAPGVVPEGGLIPTGYTSPFEGRLDIQDSEIVVMGKAEAKPKFVFGKVSLSELVGVKPEIVKVAHLALTLTTQDFGIYDGMRTKAEQIKLVNRGVSQTLKSKHLPQADGLSHAIDAVPFANGQFKWDWKLVYPVIFAIDQAATQLGYADNLRWGGAWDRRLNDFGGTVEAYKRECELYAQRHPGKDFIDGPHVEWVD